ncbi:MAG TPA: hypothetical protein VHY09_10555 [Candidatus Methylacidiphilales bacterium]|jgi:hypothetical protein|nr:hypothetical protein [Candidatus Methylacidiphilales bacterium]
MINRHSEQMSCDDVFNRPLYLAGVLDNAADELKKTWFGYEWNDRTRCNCGIVARLILEASPAKLRTLLPPIYENGVFCPTWEAMTESYCPDTGLAQNEVFRALLQAGLRREDFSHLERLSHPQIVARMAPHRRTKRAVCYSRKSDVVTYLRGWATGIEEFHDRKLAAKSATTNQTT